MKNSRRSDGPAVGSALRVLRARLGLTQSAASNRSGTPGFRTVSHWETGKKEPTLRGIYLYLKGLGFNFHDLQEALDAQNGRHGGGGAGLAARVAELERRLDAMEERGQ